MTEPLTVLDLRRLWKPHKEWLLAHRSEQPTPSRFHRACSWIDREDMNADVEDYDMDLNRLGKMTFYINPVFF